MRLHLSLIHILDHQYCYTPATGITAVDRQMEAANMMGFRFVAARGTNTLPRWQGSTIPDEMCETTAAYLDDCQRLLALYHDPAPFSMRQIVPVSYTHLDVYKRQGV